MHFHLPKPLHGWREFAGEVGIIVLGVLIALGAEQVAERIHQREELREAENGMIAELRDDDLPQAFARIAVHNCNVDQLDALEAAVEANADRARVRALARAYHPVYRSWDDQAWKAAVNSQALVSAGANRMTKWATPYVIMPVLDQMAVSEQNETAQLSANMSGIGPLTAAQQDRLFQLIASLRRYNRSMSGGSLVFMKEAGDAGVTLPSAVARQILLDSGRKYGACVQQPTTSGLDLTSQVATGPAKLRY